MKFTRHKKKLNLIFLLFIFLLTSGFICIFYYLIPHIVFSPKSKFADILNKKFATPVPTLVPSPSPSPSPRPLTFSEMNNLYGPCVNLPTLMYHHVQSKDVAVAKKQTGLTVNTDVFRSQMEYLKIKNYQTISMNDLINFFDSGKKIPSKSILITFDDGYQDFYTDAFPILRDLGFTATVFVPTGLMENPDYLTWNEIGQMNGNILFANHTWSHKSVLTKKEIMQKEILTADIQLAERGLNIPKTFAYPYGPDNFQAENYLNSLGYKLAFTTKPGSILCKQKRFDLPRIRVGNLSLSSYGF